MSLRDFARRCLFTTLQTGFRLMPMPATTRDRWRQRFLDRHHGLIPREPQGQVGDATQAERRPRVSAAACAIGHQAYRVGKLPQPMPATLVAFYLPQFHPIAENDAWWGEGFTEWHNVTRALPQFEGHEQPRLPAELGFYDLRVPTVMRKQMQLAREYGIGAFCSYFYWFGGKTLLEAPLQRWLSDPSLDLPLCLCWANENWSRQWDGRADDILIGQQHSAEDDIAFIEHVSRYLADPRYLRVDGKPLLLVYRPSLLPDARATAGRWREWCHAHDIGDIHLVYVQSFDRVDPRVIGFDVAVEFPPNNTTLTPVTARQRLINPGYTGSVFDWRELAHASMTQREPGYPRYPGVNPAWDNEPRRSGRGRVFAHASPRGYRDWLRQAIASARQRFASQPLVFINAWNEWAEGAVLEPDARLGHAWLQATRDALSAPPAADRRPCAVLHVWYLDVLDDMAAALAASGQDWRVLITTHRELADAVAARCRKLGLAADIEAFDNLGRDILPFLHVANRLLDEGVDVVLKLHTKRSAHRRDGEQWRNELFQRLAAQERTTTVLSAFRERPTLGMAYAEGHRQRLDYYWGANRDNVRALATRLGIPEPQPEQDSFVAGSMFWVRLAALRPLLDAHLDVSAFEPEAGQVDGTLAHAIERIFLPCINAAGFDSASVAELCGLPEDDAPYPYARRS